MKRISVLVLSVILFLRVQAQLPTNNPIEEFYPGLYTWTNDINWLNVKSATAEGAKVIGNDSTDNLAIVQKAIDDLSASGGGVLYFEPGTYYFSDDLILKDGVVLRGKTPVNKNAKDAGFTLESTLLFPKYNFDSLANGGNGIDNATAFKKISTDSKDYYAASNNGLVYLDINRALIELGTGFEHQSKFGGKMPFLDTNATKHGRTQGTAHSSAYTVTRGQYAERGRNKICFGVRSNNAASADPSVPKSNQNQWQRWPYRFDANIHVTSYENALVANNKINDNPTDNFAQKDYIMQDRLANTGWRPIIGTGDDGDFDYTGHSAIHVNVQMPAQAYWMSDSSISPWWYRPGVTVRDNWIYRTRRNGIQAAGNGLLIKDNIIKDKKDKWQSLNPGGIRSSAGFDYNGNRGIWIRGGNNIIVEGNYTEGYRQNTLVASRGDLAFGQKSNDGEGILIDNQGSVVEGMIVRDNEIICNWAGIYHVNGSKNIIFHANIIRDMWGNNPLMIFDQKSGTTFGGYGAWTDGLIIDSNIFEGKNAARINIANYGGPKLRNYHITNNVNNTPGTGTVNNKTDDSLLFYCNTNFDPVPGATNPKGLCNGLMHDSLYLNELLEIEKKVAESQKNKEFAKHHLVTSFILYSSFDDTSSKLEIYPNPTSGIISMQFIQKNKPVKASVYSINGQSIPGFNNMSFTDNKIDVTALSNGSYMLYVTRASGQIEAIKFIKK